ncbi:hypothetical protein [Candidatus Harpocratesius sp.]
MCPHYSNYEEIIDSKSSFERLVQTESEPDIVLESITELIKILNEFKWVLEEIKFTKPEKYKEFYDKIEKASKKLDDVSTISEILEFNNLFSDTISNLNKFTNTFIKMELSKKLKKILNQDSNKRFIKRLRSLKDERIVDIYFDLKPYFLEIVVLLKYSSDPKKNKENYMFFEEKLLSIITESQYNLINYNIKIIKGDSLPNKKNNILSLL